MKTLLLIFSFCFLSACCGTKAVVENETKTTNENIVVTEAPKAIETPPVPEHTTPPESSKVFEKIKDSIVQTKTVGSPDDSDQVVTKRILTEHQLWDELLTKHVSEKGNVNYSGIRKDHDVLLGYIRLIQITHEKINLETNRSKNELLAFWINAYNALTIDLILRNYPVNSIKDIKDPWDQRLWKFGNKWYNLNDIEHQILRKMDEPRIHFAIVCASFSCPKLQNQAFTAVNLEEQLTAATKDFLNDPTRNQITANSLKLSKIFQWFAKDFKKDGSLIDFLNQYSDIRISPNAKKRFMDYNWDLNE